MENAHHNFEKVGENLIELFEELDSKDRVILDLLNQIKAHEDAIIPNSTVGAEENESDNEPESDKSVQGMT